MISLLFSLFRSPFSVFFGGFAVLVRCCVVFSTGILGCLCFSLGFVLISWI